MNRSDYRTAEGINFSSAKHAGDSLGHYLENLRNPPEQTASMLFGELVHAAVLENKRDTYAVQPTHYPSDPSKKWNGNSAECQAWKKAQTLPILTMEDSERLQNTIAAVESSPLWQTYAAPCREREQAVFCEWDGLKLKALLDLTGWREDNGRRIVDLKVVQDGSPAGFQRAVVKYKLAMQAAFYRTVLQHSEKSHDPPEFVWATVEANPPHNVTFYVPSETMLAYGMEQMRLCLTRIRTLHEKSLVGEPVSTGYSDTPLFLELPRWATPPSDADES